MGLDVVLAPDFSIPSGAEPSFHSVDLSFLVRLAAECPGGVDELAVLWNGHPLPGIEVPQILDLCFNGRVPVVSEL